jgi:hypothetical protein
MEMRIVVPEAASTSTLAERLSVVVGMERISIVDDRREVGVRVEGASDRAVLPVIDTVERSLEERAAGSVELWLGSTRTGSPAQHRLKPGNEARGRKKGPSQRKSETS